MKRDFLYQRCPEMPLEVCCQCPYYDHLNEACGILTNSLRCGTIDESLSLKKKEVPDEYIAV